MHYNVETTDDFDKQLKKLDKHTRNIIRNWISKKLVNAHNHEVSENLY